LLATYRDESARSPTNRTAMLESVGARKRVCEQPCMREGRQSGREKSVTRNGEHSAAVASKMLTIFSIGQRLGLNQESGT
jgi:hypothetical protein